MFKDIDGVVTICNDLYVTTPESLAVVLQKLREVGYEIDNLREANYRKERGTSIETMEKNGWSLWYAHLDIRRGKCLSCNSYINSRGIQTHGHKCEICGAVTYYEIVDGSKIRFSFIPSAGHGSHAELNMKAKRWDTENRYLYLYPEVLDGFWAKGEKAQQYLKENANKWEEVVEEGQQLIKVKYPHPWDSNASAISISEIMGHYSNYDIVLLWEGKEYSEYAGNFPIPKSLHVFETWHWAPLPASPTLHKRVLEAVGNSDDKGWHYQDGRPWFSEKSFTEMGKFVRNFTTLDADAWDLRSKSFRRDGPGGIDDVAFFCHPEAEVENRPNIGNILVGAGKMLSGERLTSGEKEAMGHALKDKKERKKFTGLFGCFKPKSNT